MSRLNEEPAAETKGLAELSSLMPNVGFTMADWGCFCSDENWETSKIKMTLGGKFGN